MDARRFVAAAATLAMAVLLAACADVDDGPGGTPGTSPPPASPPATPPMPSPSPPLEETMTITGEVAEGVEVNCVLLRTGTEEYLLIGNDVDQLRFGDTVTLRGYPDPEVMTICQQGTPFIVTEVVPQ
jgi:hypothetical protein